MLSTKCTQNKTSLFRLKGFGLLGTCLFAMMALGHFHFDKLLKIYLEKTLSEAYGSSVNLERIETQLLKQKVVFHRLQFSNPEVPMRNLAELDEVHFHFILSELIHRRLIIPEMKINGVHYDTPRDESAKTTGTHGLFSGVSGAPDNSAFNIHSVVRKQMDQDPLKYLAPIALGFRAPDKVEKVKIKLATLQQVEDTKIKIEETTKAWNLFSDSLPSFEKLSLDKKTSSELLKTLEKQIKTAQMESQELKNLLENIESPLKVDVASMKNKLDLPTFERWDLTATLFGPLGLNSTERLHYWSALAREKIPAPVAHASVQVIASPRKAGLSFHFGTPRSKPSFIIDKISIESQLDPTRPSKGMVTGLIKQFTFDSGLLGVPIECVIEADFPSKNLRHLRFDGTISHNPNKMVETFALSIQELPLNKWILYRNSDFKLVMGPAKASLDSKVSLIGSNINLQWKLGISEPNITISSRYIQVEDLMKEFLKRVGDFEVNTRIAGPLNQLTYHTESSIGSHLADELRKSYDKALEGVDDDLKNRLVEQIALPRRAVLETLTESENKHLSQWQTLREKLDLLQTEKERNASNPLRNQRPQSKRVKR